MSLLTSSPQAVPMKPWSFWGSIRLRWWSPMKGCPVWGGAEFLSLVQNRAPQAIRIMLSGQPSLESVLRAINTGDDLESGHGPVDPIQSI